MWAALYWQVEAPRTFITSGGLGTMGFGLPAAVGASLARPGERVICIAGDGSILMNAQELETCARYNLPVKVFVFNNSSLGMVRQWQELFWDRRYAETLTDSPCDFAKLAQGYGVKGWRAEISSEVESAIDAALSCGGPALVDILVPREELVMPMVPPGRSLTDFIHGLAVKS
jgi:acetolactate synthase-1/2/3 large subunit